MKIEKAETQRCPPKGLQFELPPHLYDKLQQMAQVSGKTVEEVIEGLVRDEVDRLGLIQKLEGEQ
jgi:hypothetical protein